MTFDYLALLHDSELVGLNYANEKSIRLDFDTDRGDRVSILLTGVRRFIATNLLDGNIVLDVISTVQGGLDLASALATLERAFCDEFERPEHQGSPKYSPEWKSWLGGVKSGTLHVFVVEPSYGAEVVALCSDIVCSAAPRPTEHTGSDLARTHSSED